jgi:hypothetical protein
MVAPPPALTTSTAGPSPSAFGWTAATIAIMGVLFGPTVS